MTESQRERIEKLIRADAELADISREQWIRILRPAVLETLLAMNARGDYVAAIAGLHWQRAKDAQFRYMWTPEMLETIERMAERRAYLEATEPIEDEDWALE